MTFTWQQGRQLASATLTNGTAITYRYNPDGIRIGKTVGNISTEYLVDASGTIHAMKQGGHTQIFMYDATGRREGFICYSSTYGNAAYYYLYNAQGDGLQNWVIAIILAIKIMGTNIVVQAIFN